MMTMEMAIMMIKMEMTKKMMKMKMMMTMTMKMAITRRDNVKSFHLKPGHCAVLHLFNLGSS